MSGYLIQPQSVEELIAWFEENFACVVGWPISRTGEGEPPSLEEMNSRHSSDWPGTFRYETFGFTADDTDLDRRRLVIAMHIAFSRKLLKNPEIRGTRLYWRYREKIILGTVYGLSSIHARVAIPALVDHEGLPIEEKGHPLRSLYIEA